MKYKQKPANNIQKNANKFFNSEQKPLEFKDAIKEANNQKAFVFWNHPNWEANRSDGIAKLDPIHNKIIKEKLLHGIEVVNFDTFSEEALKIALENNLILQSTNSSIFVRISSHRGSSKGSPPKRLI